MLILSFPIIPYLFVIPSLDLGPVRASTSAVSMPTDGGLSLAAVSSALNVGLRVVQTGFELKSVPENARGLLDTIKTVNEEIKHAHFLRRQKSALLHPREKNHIDEQITASEKAMAEVEALVEPARVDMETKFGRVGTWKRAVWVVKQSPKVDTTLARLNAAIISLNAAVITMSTREGEKSTGAIAGAKEGGDTPSSPPDYATSQYLHQRRMTRRNARGSRTATRSSTPMETRRDETLPTTANARLGRWDIEQATMTNSSTLERQVNAERAIPTALVPAHTSHRPEAEEQREPPALPNFPTSYRRDNQQNQEFTAIPIDNPQHLNPFAGIHELEGSFMGQATQPRLSIPEHPLPYPVTRLETGILIPDHGDRRAHHALASNQRNPRLRNAQESHPHVPTLPFLQFDPMETRPLGHRTRPRPARIQMHDEETGAGSGQPLPLRWDGPRERPLDDNLVGRNMHPQPSNGLPGDPQDPPPRTRSSYLYEAGFLN